MSFIKKIVVKIVKIICLVSKFKLNPIGNKTAYGSLFSLNTH